MWHWSALSCRLLAIRRVPLSSPSQKSPYVTLGRNSLRLRPQNEMIAVVGHLNLRNGGLMGIGGQKRPELTAAFPPIARCLVPDLWMLRSLPTPFWVIGKGSVSKNW